MVQENITLENISRGDITQENNEMSEEKKDIKKENNEDNLFVTRKRAVSHRKVEKIKDRNVEATLQKEIEEEEPSISRSGAGSRKINNIEVNHDEKVIITPRSRGKTIQTIIKKEGSEKEIKKKLSYENNDLEINNKELEKEKLDFALLDYFLSFINQENLNLTLSGYFQKVFNSLVGTRNKTVR